MPQVAPASSVNSIPRGSCIWWKVSIRRAARLSASRNGFGVQAMATWISSCETRRLSAVTLTRSKRFV